MANGYPISVAIETSMNEIPKSRTDCVLACGSDRFWLPYIRVHTRPAFAPGLGISTEDGGAWEAASMTLLKIGVETVPPLPKLNIKEPIMAIEVEDLIQAVAEGVLRAAEARGGSHQSGQAAPAASSQAATTSRPELISQLSFEVRIRAGGISAFQTQAAE